MALKGTTTWATDGSSGLASAYDSARNQYGAKYTKAMEAALNRTQQKAMSSGMQNLVSSGLAGTSAAGNLANKFAEETAAPTRLAAELARAQGLAGIDLQEASANQQSALALMGLASAYKPTSVPDMPKTQGAKDTSYDQRMADWRSGGMTSQAAMTTPTLASQIAGARQTTPQQSTGQTVVTIGGQKYIYGDDGMFRKA